MPSFKVECDADFEVFCASCGAGLCQNCKEGRTRGRSMPYIEVDPCDVCAKKEYDQGYADAEKELSKDIT